MNDMTGTQTIESVGSEEMHEHYTISYAFGRPQAIWSTRDECTKCGCGRPLIGR